jgi:phosphoribosyl 1,2-cyclic phosphodiesterase
VKLTSLGSGSSGNAFLLEDHEQRVLIDCGVGVRAIQRSLAGSDLPITMVISHEHIDHVRAMASVLKSHPCNVIATEGTLGAIGRQANWKSASIGERVQIGSTSISFVHVSHDAAEPCGFLIETPDLTASILTDLGNVTLDVLDAVAESNVIVLESNYDEGMLRKSRYPAHLKRRIRGTRGHLSNDDCAATLAEVASADTLGIWLCHLSHNNNTPEAAVYASTDALRRAGKDIPVTALARFDETRILPFRSPARQGQLFQT